MDVHARDELSASGGLLMGRVTYEGFVEYWPTAKDEIGVADLMNGLPKFVASTTLDEVEWDNVSVLTGDVPDAVSQLKQEPGRDLLLLASAGLGRTLREHDLIESFGLRSALPPTARVSGTSTTTVKVPLWISSRLRRSARAS
jgi:dihydrofolate reductase